jgi:hypothetical protein
MQTISADDVVRPISFLAANCKRLMIVAMS